MQKFEKHTMRMRSPARKKSFKRSVGRAMKRNEKVGAGCNGLRFRKTDIVGGLNDMQPRA